MPGPYCLGDIGKIIRNVNNTLCTSNLDVSDTGVFGGLLTAKSGLTVNNGVTITSGGLTITTGGANVTGIITANTGIYTNALSVQSTINASNGINVIAGGITVNGGNITLNNNNKIVGNGSLLTSLNASELTSGTIPDSVLATKITPNPTNPYGSSTSIPIINVDSKGRITSISSVGISTSKFVGATDAANAPSHTWTHATNTGMFSVNASSIGFSTGGNERMTIYNGNVGIGTSLPNAPLQFATNVSARKIVLYEGQNNDYQFYGFGVVANTLKYQVYAQTDNHIFYAGTSATSEVELMRIQGNNKVGIGVANPTCSLDVNGDINITGNLYVGGVNLTSTVGFGGSGSGPGPTTSTTFTVGFQYDSTNKMVRLTGSNYVVSNSAPLFTLPEGRRPLVETTIMPTTTSAGYAQIRITSSGDVICEVGMLGSYVTLEGLCFPIDTSGWVNISSSYAQNPGTHTLACYKDQNGIVYLKGGILNPTSSKNIYLPIGYQPMNNFLSGICVDNRYGEVRGQPTPAPSYMYVREVNGGSWASFDGVFYNSSGTFITLSPMSSWAANGSYKVGAFKDVNGVVSLQGLHSYIPLKANLDTDPNSRQITTLPVGYRPLVDTQFLGGTNHSSGSKGGFAKLIIKTTGAIIYDSPSADYYSFVCISNIAFTVDGSSPLRSSWTIISPWVTPTLQNGWTSASTNLFQYMKEDNGRVSLRGMVIAGTSNTICRVESICYPKGRIFFAGNSNIEVNSNGDLYTSSLVDTNMNGLSYFV